MVVIKKIPRGKQSPPWQSNDFQRVSKWKERPMVLSLEAKMQGRPGASAFTAALVYKLFLIWGRSRWEWSWQVCGGDNAPPDRQESWWPLCSLVQSSVLVTNVFTGAVKHHFAPSLYLTHQDLHSIWVFKIITGQHHTLQGLSRGPTRWEPSDLWKGRWELRKWRC